MSSELAKSYNLPKLDGTRGSSVVRGLECRTDDRKVLRSNPIPLASLRNVAISLTLLSQDLSIWCLWDPVHRG